MWKIDRFQARITRTTELTALNPLKITTVTKFKFMRATALSAATYGDES